MPRKRVGFIGASSRAMYNILEPAPLFLSVYERGGSGAIEGQTDVNPGVADVDSLLAGETDSMSERPRVPRCLHTKLRVLFGWIACRSS